MSKRKSHQRGGSIAALLDVIGVGSSPAPPKTPTEEQMVQFEKLKVLEHGYRDKKVELHNARGKVLELQRTIKSAAEEKFQNDKLLITKLQQSQRELLETMASVRHSKSNLIQTAALEMDRLRSIVRVLQDQIRCITTGKSLALVTPQATTNYMIYNSNIKQLHALGFDTPDIKVIHTNEEEKAMMDDSNALFTTPNPDYLQFDLDEHKNGGSGGGDSHMLSSKTGSSALHTTASAVADNSEAMSDPRVRSAMHLFAPSIDCDDSAHAFPHNNIGSIDIRTLSYGDGQTYADPYASVEFKYTGYIFDNADEEWHQFTDDNMSGKIFSTALGASSNIIGLEQAMLSMTVGEEVKVWVPSRLGYGPHGAGDMIPPDSDLIFRLSLVSVSTDNAYALAESPMPDEMDMQGDDDDPNQPSSAHDVLYQHTGVPPVGMPDDSQEMLVGLNSVEDYDDDDDLLGLDGADDAHLASARGYVPNL